MSVSFSIDKFKVNSAFDLKSELLLFVVVQFWGTPEVVTGQLADTPTRGLDNSRTSQLADWTSRGLDNSRMPPTGVFVVLIALLGYVDMMQLTESLA